MSPAILAIAAIGFAFDTYELLMLPLVAPAALPELGIAPGTPAYVHWISLLFWVPAIAGGIFGLLGGYLTDLWGRRRVLTGSILLYAVSAAATAFVSSPEALLVWRTLTFIGVCVEFVAAVAWLAELFPDPAARERALGYTQAFGSVGGLIVSYVAELCAKNADAFPAVLGGHAAWRYTLISGLLPALPLILLRPLLPESPVWVERRAAGTLERPSLAELFAPLLRRTTLITTAMMALSFAVAFGAIQQLPSIARGLPSMKGLAPKDVARLAATVQKSQEWGGLLGRCLLALLATRIASRRTLLRAFLVPGLLVIPAVFLFTTTDLETMKYGAFFAGLLTIGQFSFWGNYLPLVFPLHLRGTGEGFAANIGGRMIGTAAFGLTTALAAGQPAHLAPMAALVGGLALAGSLALTFAMPEPSPAVVGGGDVAQPDRGQ